MSTILCGQPSNDSSHLVQATTMTLKLVSSKPYNQKTTFDDYFYQDISSCLDNPKSLKLSQQSLELCTESLCTETGSDMSDDDATFAALVSSLSATKRRRDKVESKKVLPRSFPPPLMSMSGPKLFRVLPQRKEGRLIIQGIETDLVDSCLRAERSEGRLQLTCWKDEEDDSDSDSDLDLDLDSEKFQRVRRCSEDDENGDKGIGNNNWEPSCWVAIS